MENNLKNRNIGIEVPEILKGMVKVVGVGDRGIKIISQLFLQGCRGLDLITCYAYIDSLKSSTVSTKILLDMNVGLVSFVFS
ncbi:MAG: hypothetical protein GZ091_14125 [Paludibacter sp.]|nr:hypothetical protein [Paludibacter sp.]